MRWIVAIVLLVLAVAALPNNRVLSQGEDYLPLPVSAAPKIAMSLPTTGDPRADLMAIMTLSATLLSLAESVRGRHIAVRNGGEQEDPLSDLIEAPAPNQGTPQASEPTSEIMSDLGC